MHSKEERLKKKSRTGPKSKEKPTGGEYNDISDVLPQVNAIQYELFRQLEATYMECHSDIKSSKYNLKFRKHFRSLQRKYFQLIKIFYDYQTSKCDKQKLGLLRRLKSNRQTTRLRILARRFFARLISNTYLKQIILDTPQKYKTNFKWPKILMGKIETMVKGQIIRIQQKVGYQYNNPSEAYLRRGDYEYNLRQRASIDFKVIKFQIFQQLQQQYMNLPKMIDFLTKAVSEHLQSLATYHLQVVRDLYTTLMTSDNEKNYMMRIQTLIQKNYNFKDLSPENIKAQIKNLNQMVFSKLLQNLHIKKIQKIKAQYVYDFLVQFHSQIVQHLQRIKKRILQRKEIRLLKSQKQFLELLPLPRMYLYTQARKNRFYKILKNEDQYEYMINQGDQFQCSNLGCDNIRTRNELCRSCYIQNLKDSASKRTNRFVNLKLKNENQEKLNSKSKSKSKTKSETRSKSKHQTKQQNISKSLATCKKEQKKPIQIIKPNHSYRLRSKQEKIKQNVSSLSKDVQKKKMLQNQQKKTQKYTFQAKRKMEESFKDKRGNLNSMVPFAQKANTYTIEQIWYISDQSQQENVEKKTKIIQKPEKKHTKVHKPKKIYKQKKEKRQKINKQAPQQISKKQLQNVKRQFEDKNHHEQVSKQVKKEEVSQQQNNRSELKNREFNTFQPQAQFNNFFLLNPFFPPPNLNNFSPSYNYQSYPAQLIHQPETNTYASSYQQPLNIVFPQSFPNIQANLYNSNYQNYPNLPNTNMIPSLKTNYNYSMQEKFKADQAEKNQPHIQQEQEWLLSKQKMFLQDPIKSKDKQTVKEVKQSQDNRYQQTIKDHQHQKCSNSQNMSKSDKQNNKNESKEVKKDELKAQIVQQRSQHEQFQEKQNKSQNQLESESI